MIGRLRGLLLEKKPPQMLVDVHGVGYEIEAPMSTFYQLPEVGSEVVLYTHLIVREDAHALFGFASETERQMFRNLIRINSVGAKLALSILSGMSADDFSRCVHENDTASLTRLPGVGKKTAERLVIEMRDRLADWEPPAPARTHPAREGGVNEPLAEREALSALIALGYKPQEASRLLQHVDSEGMESEAIIKAALKVAIQ